MATRNQLISTEEWIKLLPEKQTSYYTYPKAQYKGTDELVEITCPVHGNFWQLAYSHKKGKDCKKCATIRGADKIRSNTETFVEKTKTVKEISGLYTYAKTNYVNNHTNVTVTCPKHGDFEITPGGHLAGRGCQKCYNDRRYLVRLKTPEEFAIQLETLGKNHDHSKVIYNRAKDKITIICKTHGEFRMTPDNYLNGQDCPGCASHGYRTSLPGYLYILSDNVTTKVGITNRKPSDRAKAIYKTGGPKLDIIAAHYFQDGHIPRSLELACHKYLASLYKPVDTIFDGSTECFIGVDIPALLAFITPLATQTETV